MKRTKDGLRAHEMEHVACPERPAGAISTKLFCIDTLVGLFVRVPHKSEHKDGVVAYLAGSLCTFVPARRVNDELQAAGCDMVTPPAPGDDDTEDGDDTDDAPGQAKLPFPDDDPLLGEKDGFIPADEAG